MQFRLIINCDNAAFETDPAMEVRRILKRLVVGENGPRYDRRSGTVRDVNGNTVGSWEFTDNEED